MNLGTILDAIKIWVEGLISSMGYTGLGITMFLENVFPPIPSEIVLPLAGSLTLTGRFTILGVVFFGMLGSLAGAYLFYGLGKWLGIENIRKLVGKIGKYMLITVEDFDNSLDWFNKHGELVIFFGRMVPIIRSLISIPAGVASMNMVRFTIFTIAGTSLWNFLLAYGGKLLGQQWPKIADWIGTYQNVVIVLAVAAVVVFVVMRLRKMRKEKAVN